MKVITIAHQKGGVGKTTLAINLAYAFAESAQVVLIDADEQQSVMSLAEDLRGLKVIKMGKQLPADLSSYDLAIIDTPPYLSSQLPNLFAQSDYVLVPTKAGILDAMAIKGTISLLRQSMEVKPALRAGIVLNMVLPRTSLTDEVRELVTGYDIPLHTAMLSQRVSYARSPMTAGVFGSDDARAKMEVIQLATEILDRLD